jgi:hypothetical protein
MKILINNMSNYFKAALLLGTITMVGCEKRLDIAPTQSIADNLALNTEGDVLVTLVGKYILPDIVKVLPDDKPVSSITTVS